MLRSKKLVGVALSTLVLLAACGANDENNNENEGADANENVEENEEVNDEEETNNEENEEVDEQPETEVTEGEIFNTFVGEETDGDLELIYTNTNANYVNDMDGFIITVEAYEVVKVTDMHANHADNFGDEREGYVVTAKATLENTRDNDVYYNANLGIRLADNHNVVHAGRMYVPEERQLKADADVNMFKANTEQEFWFASRVTNDQFDEMLENGARYIIEGNASETGEYSDSLGGDQTFDFNVTEEQAGEATEAHDFYRDDFTANNMGEKTLFAEVADLNDSQELEGVTATVEGVQYVDFVPNEANEARFSNFEGEDIVILTAKLLVDNESDETVSLFMLDSMVNANDGEGRYLSSTGSSVSQNDLEPGQSGEAYLTFIFQKKYFNIYDELKLEVGPFRDAEAQDLFKGLELEFDLPLE
ncbi:DUF5068 domain-containing protein [Salipaludibacillus agaradhaerens]|uniref:DUF5068 domain-containing protein n=1 Tax=Salipaludibacillus agaradhaerens TaxID=76935 RepID=UPI002150EC2C|nr:DUF5068 domain-containing protein [Salipaludibacillus agaradhaerens]MCR6105035.1 DUF5068 domain-containing protein [Salipaludibacillus agaradhaerens]MCR6117080.1 DUF5068 domain-containing protein [Salipaludibacillus agaradhaerens]